MALFWFALGVVVLVLLVVAEGKRQERRYGRSKGANLARTGMLELQRLLEPERKVEVLLERREEVATDAAGDLPPEESGATADRPRG